MPLEWPEKARKAVSLFFRKWNDIDVYVEDNSFSTMKVYNEILSRLSGEQYRVERVFPLGPKHKVIEACAKHDTNRGREALYIVDGDLDLLLETLPPMLERLYVQERYCLENYLVDCGAMSEIIYEDNPSLSRSEALAIIGFDEYQREMHKFLELFVVFATMRLLIPGVKSVALGLSSFFKWRQ